MTLVITSTCIDVKDGICTTVCPVDCIYEGERMFYIHPTECIECGMCESICPVDAIRYADEVEEEQRPFLALNEDAFRGASGAIEEPGGWKKGDQPFKDPAELANLARHFSINEPV
ncbi:ferredoxin family protein [uncultured Roseibium sp.]|uniref:4Fe-4S dicluster domain-containing protein n=1 Tax=uncultured Roseibium sp. TaxID=1936171 RepID=UPI0026029395|nr:ferredoxin family protein [uncultured Roseibium sp.]